VLNNWWHYVVDYEAAVALAKSTPPVGVHEENSLTPPRMFGLEQNYPNPFNPSTTIQFTLDRPENVSLKVYDILGREVATLLNEWMHKGLHAAYWDARECSSGVYYYRLQTENRFVTKRMVLVK
jgi:hypothetical protein